MRDEGGDEMVALVCRKDLKAFKGIEEKGRELSMRVIRWMLAKGEAKKDEVEKLFVVIDTRLSIAPVLGEISSSSWMVHNSIVAI